MDVIERAGLETQTDRRSAAEAAVVAWRALQRAARSDSTTEPAAAAEGGPGLGGSAAEQDVHRGAAYAEFDVSDDTGEVVVRIIDEASGMLIRTIPPDELAECIRSGEGWTRAWHLRV